MGLDIEHLNLDRLSEKDSWSDEESCSISEDLARLGGNSIHMRAALCAISVLLRALNPRSARNYLKPA